MALQVLDSSNLDAIVRDATGEGLTPPPLPEGTEAAPGAKESKSAPSANGEIEADDKPGEDGLTPREKRELSSKMQRAVAKRVVQIREAEEFAAEEMRGRRHAEQHAEALERELEQLRTAQAAAAAPPAAEPEPDRNKFATEGEYISALVSFRVLQALAAGAAAQAKQAAEAEAAEILEAASARISKAIELVPDFEEITKAADVKIPPAVAGYMQQSEMFAELGYFLAKNPETVVAMQKMKPALQLVEIGKIESRLAPFAPDSTGAKGSSKTDGEPAKPAPRAAATGAVADPRAAATGAVADPSAARRAAPVITPITTSGAGSGDFDPNRASVRENIAEIHRKGGPNLLRRQRH
jgi:hypothetical protein